MRGPRLSEPRSIKALAAALERAFHLALHFPLRYVAALVALLLTARDGELDLDPAVLEVQPCRDERQALLAHRPVERVDLTPVEQELPRPNGLVVLAPALVVDRDLEAVQPRFAVAHVGIGLGHRRPPFAERLDLGAGQHDARLEPLQQLVFVARAAIFCDQLLRHSTRVAWGTSRVGPG